MENKPLDMQAAKLKKDSPQRGYYRELLEVIYNLCLEFNQAPIKKNVPAKISIHNGIDCLEKHGINVQEILKNEYHE